MISSSTKPYLIRSIYDWCCDSGFTPYISVKVSDNLDVPKQYVRNNEIIFNISVDAVHQLIITNETVSFTARFDGVVKKLEIPVDAVTGIFSKEVNQGISFSSDQNQGQESLNELENVCLDRSQQISQEKKVCKPKFRVIK